GRTRPKPGSSGSAARACTSFLQGNTWVTVRLTPPGKARPMPPVGPAKLLCSNEGLRGARTESLRVDCSGPCRAPSPTLQVALNESFRESVTHSYASADPARWLGPSSGSDCLRARLAGAAGGSPRRHPPRHPLGPEGVSAGAGRRAVRGAVRPSPGADRPPGGADAGGRGGAGTGREPGCPGRLGHRAVPRRRLRLRPRGLVPYH